MRCALWAQGSQEEIKKTVLTKLNAARGGGYIFQSDHSVPSNVSGQNYDYVVKLVREYGRVPAAVGRIRSYGCQVKRKTYVKRNA